MSPIAETALRKLEFDKVVERVAALTVSDPGRGLAKRICPLPDRSSIERELRAVSEAKELLIAEGSIPIEPFRDVLPALKKTTVENQSLSTVELLEIAALLRTARAVHQFLSKRASQVPILGTFVPRVTGDKVVEYNITEALDDHGGVKDGASRELREIRRSMAGAGEALRRRLESILRSVSEQELVQDEIITTRDGRLVIPIKTEFKNRVRGFIHSTSASGATVYVEPAESLELNNALRELQLREQREIHRVLVALTAQVGAIRPETESSFAALVELDVLFAKGRYSIEIIGMPPAIVDEPRICITQARHPVLLRHLRREEVVPLSIALGDDDRTLVITGPNAGGKTVALKTVGLLAVMAQAGLHLPAASESEVFPFTKIFVDIGDDQSIEDDLSTFSSHLMMLRQLLAGADRETLVLLDEIGAGTDPAEGGALAATVLRMLTERGAVTLATTHHGALKVFAHETPGVVNGSMEFDTATLRPTYRFRPGVPGSSYAFELAERIGLPAEVLADARRRVGGEKAKLESLLVDLELRTHTLEGALASTGEEKERLQELVQSYEQKMLQLRRELATIRKKAVEEARDLVVSAQRTIEESVRTIRESGGNKEIIRESRGLVRKLHEQLTVAPVEEPEETDVPEEFRVGDLVRMRDGTGTGEIVEIRGEQVVLVSGNSRLRLPVSAVRRAPPSAAVPVPAASAGPTMPEATTEIDVRGMLGDEAIERIVPFLDNAYAAGLHRVDIIHGKGTGALRKRVGEFLKSVPQVKSYRLGEWNEGGAGVTVVELH